MDFKKDFTILAKKYNLNYQYQDFKNCFGGNWWVYTHSLYNGFWLFYNLILLFVVEREL